MTNDRKTRKINAKKNGSAVLALLLLGCALAACGETAEQPLDTAGTAADVSAAEVSAVDTENENIRAGVKDSLPDSLDYNGRTFTVYYANDYDQRDYIEGADMLTGEIVDDAIFTCTASVEDRLNIDLRFTPDDTALTYTVAGNVSKQIMAADPTNDIFFGQQCGMVQLITDGAFVNAYDIDHFDFSQPWWNNSYMDEISVGRGSRFFLVGDYTLSALRLEHVLFYNKTMYARYYDNADGLYEETLNGTWTMDRLAEVSRSVFSDLNGSGSSDAEDQLGYIAFKAAASTDPFAYLAGIPYAEHDKNGAVTIELLQDRAVTLTEKVVSFFHQAGSFYNMEDGDDLFLGMRQLTSAKSLRDMTDDFGFLPYPKLDEAQEAYHGLVADIVLLGAIPTSSLNTDMAGAVLEALNAETYRSVVPLWYETALKIKYARDDISSQIIDLIHDSVYTSFLYAYSPCLDTAGVFMRSLVENNSTDYVSTVTKLAKSLQKRLDGINEAFEQQ